MLELNGPYMAGSSHSQIQPVGLKRHKLSCIQIKGKHKAAKLLYYTIVQDFTIEY